MGLFTIIMLTQFTAQVEPTFTKKVCNFIDSRDAYVCAVVRDYGSYDRVSFEINIKGTNQFKQTRKLDLEFRTYCGMRLAEKEAYLAICIAEEGHPFYYFYPLDYVLTEQEVESFGSFYDYHFDSLSHLSADGVITYEATYRYDEPQEFGCVQDVRCTVTQKIRGFK